MCVCVSESERERERERERKKERKRERERDYLDCISSRLVGHFRCESLSYGGIVGVFSSLVCLPSRAIRAQSRSFDPDSHVSQHGRHSLVLDDLHAKGLSLKGILCSFIESSLSQTHSTSCNLCVRIKFDRLASCD